MLKYTIFPRVTGGNIGGITACVLTIRDESWLVVHFFSLFSSQNELPPPYYSVAVHTQPPLKSYEEVVYDVHPGLTLPTHPHYIPQYPPPVAVPPVKQSSTGECHPQPPYFPEDVMDAGVRTKEMDYYCVYCVSSPQLQEEGMLQE